MRFIVTALVMSLALVGTAQAGPGDVAHPGQVGSGVQVVQAPTSTGNTLVMNGWSLPRDHQYEVWDPSARTFSPVDVNSIPSRVERGEWILDRTGSAWVFHPDIGGRNAKYFTQASPSASAPAGSQGAWQHVHGTVTKAEGSTLTFRADDGRTLTVDMSQVNASVQKGLTPGEGATVVGFPGAQGNQFTARYIQQDSSDPARGGRVVGQTTPAPATAAAPKTPVDEKAWQRIHGTVQSVSGNRLTLKTDDGRTLNVDMASVNDAVRKALTPGEGVTVVGHLRGDQNTVAAQFIQQDSGAGAASPKTK
jgi:hypothetical protein